MVDKIKYLYYINYDMKKAKLLSLTLAATLLVGMACVPARSNDEKNQKKPVKKVRVVKPKPDLKYATDTIVVSNKNIKDLKKKCAAGVFCSASNKITLYYFMPASNSPEVMDYCQRNNSSMQLVWRHETEHARKAGLFKNGKKYSAFVRGEMAAMNEVMAPASEIIEAVEYHEKNGAPITAARYGIAEADSAIMAIKNKYFFWGRVDFGFQPIADEVLNWAFEKFLRSVNRGYYKHTIKNAYNCETPTKYNPSKECDKYQYMWKFFPEYGVWNGVWTFETSNGMCDIFAAASEKARQRLINRVDSVVCVSVGIDPRCGIVNKCIMR